MLKPASYRELVQVLVNLPMLLHEARRARGVTLREAAKQTGLSFNTIMRMEKGTDSSMSSAIAVMNWLDQTKEGS